MKKIFFILFGLILSFEQKLNAETINQIYEGNIDAKVTIIIYESLTCGHCAKFHNEVFPKIKTEYIDTGKIVFTYRDFPLDKFALKASVIARCSGNERFFSFLKVLYKKQKDWTSTQDPFKSLLKIAKLGGLKNDEIKVCVGNKSIEDGILKQRLDSTKEFDIKATPTIYLNGKKYEGDLTYEALKLKLDSLIN